MVKSRYRSRSTSRGASRSRSRSTSRGASRLRSRSTSRGASRSRSHSTSRTRARNTSRDVSAPSVYSTHLAHSAYLATISVTATPHKVSIQTNPSNFGHTNMVHYTGIQLPQRKLITNLDPSLLNNNAYSASFKTGGMRVSPIAVNSNHRALLNYIINNNNNIDNLKRVPKLYFSNSCDVFGTLRKSFENKLINFVEDQKDYFMLYKYSHDTPDSTIYMNEDEPTLCISIFMQYDNMFNKNFDTFLKKYFPPQLRLILTFKTHFPKGNVMIYLDKYMLDTFQTIPPTDARFDFQNLEQDENQMAVLEKAYSDYLAIVHKEVHTDLMSQIIYLYQTAAMHNSDHFYGNIFAYKFGGPFTCYYEEKERGVFIETQQETAYQGHISFGYIGQIVRYMIMASTNYWHNDKLIKRPKHVVVRDAHATCPGTVDIAYIRNFNSLCKNSRSCKYMLAISSPYEAAWHNDIQCGNDIVKRSVYAGLIQMANFTNDVRIMDMTTWVSSLGYPYILNRNKSALIITNERPWTYIFDTNGGRLVGNCLYGIDEYVFTSLFCFDETVNKSIYLVYMYMSELFWYHKVILSNGQEMLSPIYVALVLLTYICYKLQLFDRNTDTYVVFNTIENMRNINDPIYKSQRFKNLATELETSSDQLINYIEQFLTILPTKYHINIYMFNYWWRDYIAKIDIEIFVADFINQINNTIISNIPMEFKTLIKNFNNYGLRKLISSDEWCVRPFLKKLTSNKAPVDRGFYDDSNYVGSGTLLKTPQDLLKHIKSAAY